MADIKHINFEFDGKQAVVSVPETPCPERKWLWRAEFFGAFANVDNALLRDGWHIAYVKLSDMFGHESAICDMKKFRDYIVKEYGLAEKAVICGMSRGGLYAVNYAAEYPEDVAGLYLDAPVLNLLSWPFGFGKGCGSTDDVVKCKEVYGLDESGFINYRNFPIDRTDTLLDNYIPICFICGGADNVVPFCENAEVMIEKYKMRNGDYKLFFKPECGHHPHSLDDVSEAVSYIKNM